MTKFIASVSILALGWGMGILVLMYGWGLEVKSWGWVIVSGIVGQLLIAAINQVIKEEGKKEGK